MEFRAPWLLIFLPVLWFGLWYWLRRTTVPSLSFSSVRDVQSAGESWKTKFFLVPFVLRALALTLLLIALAGPRQVLDEAQVTTEGIDIVLALDCSGSMAAEDFSINGRRWSRFEIIKKVVGEFIQQRKNDQLALIAFAGRAYTACPLTTDHEWLLTNLQRLNLGVIEDGTAIGSGIASGLSRLKNSKAKSKIIILLTDGVNNTGNIDPLTAAKMAAAMGVKVYTIGAGAKGFAPFPVHDLFGHTFYQNIQSDLDEDTLKKIADITHAQYFRATDTESLRNIYRDIDRLEKSKIQQKGYRQYRDLFGLFTAWALIVLALELAINNTLFFKIP